MWICGKNGVLAHYFKADGIVEPIKPAQSRSSDISREVLDMKALDNIRSVEVQSGKSLLAKVFENFKKDVAIKIEELRENIDDPKALGAGAHAIKSMSLNLGTKALSAYCREREADWKNNLIGDARREIEVLQGHYLDAIRALEPIVKESSEPLES